MAEYIKTENKWKSEELVFEYTKKLFNKHQVIYQHRPYFLRTYSGQMSYDVFVCGENIAIEYQGKQHFEPVEFFGGQKHFEEQRKRDALKREKSEQNGVILIYVNYWEEIFDLKDDLNDVLTKLGFAEIDGCYYARSAYIPQGNWIVAFDKDLDNLASDYYGNSEIAKIRYFGLYQE